MAKCCSRWIRLMAIRASREPYRLRALYADRRQPYRHRIPCDGRQAVSGQPDQSRVL
jgi:hypothetical protein